jgi:hypothetical protein
MAIEPTWSDCQTLVLVFRISVCRISIGLNWFFMVAKAEIDPNVTCIELSERLSRTSCQWHRAEEERQVRGPVEWITVCADSDRDVESSGRWCNSFFHKIGRQIRTCSYKGTAYYMFSMWQRLSIAVQWGNAACILGTEHWSGEDALCGFWLFFSFFARDWHKLRDCAAVAEECRRDWNKKITCDRINSVSKTLSDRETSRVTSHFSSLFMLVNNKLHQKMKH